MKYTKLISLIILLFSINSFGKGKVVATVELSPIGSFEAKSSKIRGKIEKNSDGSFSAKKITVKVTSLKTGIELRDNHLHKSMLAKKNKKVILTNAKASNGKGTAKLSIRGVTKPIKFTYKDKGGKLDINFSINLNDYKFEDINYKGVGVEEKLKLNVVMDYK
jgi:polyisoprenoid-binding protein YceI